ncbi:MAG: glycosyltransferase [Ignavibacteriales bacterium]|nr:glycosyltransferase [Ignavibacteriales bacterium]
MPNEALIIIPTYNELDNIKTLVPDIFALEPERVDILVVDDGSPDGTGDYVASLAEKDERVKLIRREGKQGLGSAYVAGFRYALERGYDYVFEMDADYSHDPKEIPNFLEAVADADLVIGSRYVTGVNVINWPMRRLLLSYFASHYTRFITGMPVKDPTGGFKCFRRRALEAIDLDRINSNGYSFQIEMNFKVYKKGFRIKEIPIIFHDRVAGDSKMNRAIVYEAVFMVWKLRLRSIFGSL